MPYTRRLRVDNGAWKDLPGSFAKVQKVLGATHSAALSAIDKGAYAIEFQILLDGFVVFQTPYPTQPRKLNPGKERRSIIEVSKLG